MSGLTTEGQEVAVGRIRNSARIAIKAELERLLEQSVIVNYTA